MLLTSGTELSGIVEDVEIKQKIKQILEVYLRDNTNAYELQVDGSYVPVEVKKRIVNSQLEMHHLMKSDVIKGKFCEPLNLMIN